MESINKKRNLLLSLVFCTGLLVVTFSSVGKQIENTKSLIWEKSFNAFVNQELVKWKVPGAAVAVVKDGKIIYARGFGVRSLKDKQLVNKDTLFAIGSLSKSVTATTMGIQVDQGLYDWDSKVINLIPDFKLKDEYASQHLTPLDVLSHRSGLPSHNFVWYVTDFDRASLVYRLRYLEPSYELREKFQYNPLMYNLAGYVVGEQASDSWENFTRAHILEPLNMNRSNFSFEDMVKDSNYASPYIEKNGEVIATNFHSSQALSAPAGGINSSVNEFANWMIMNLNEGQFDGKEIVSEENLNYIHSPHMTMPSFEKAGSGPEGAVYSHVKYGLGWLVATYHDQIILEHSGAIDGFASMMTLLPKLDAGVLVLTNNQSGGGTFSNTISSKAISYLMKREPFDLSQWFTEQNDDVFEPIAQPVIKLFKHSAEELKHFVGNYHHDGYGDIQISGTNEGGVNFKFYRFETPMIALKKNVFKTVGGVVNRQVRLTKEAGQVDGLEVQWDRSVKPIHFIKTK